MTQEASKPNVPSATQILGPAPEPRITMAILHFQWEVGRNRRLVASSRYGAGLRGRNGVQVVQAPNDDSPLSEGYKLINIWHPYLTDEEMVKLEMTPDPKKGRPRLRFCHASAVTDRDLVQEAIDSLNDQMTSNVNEDLPAFQFGPNTYKSVQHFSMSRNAQGRDVLMTNYGCCLWDQDGLVTFVHRDSRVVLSTGWQVVAMDIIPDFSYTFARGATTSENILPVILGLQKQLEALSS